MGYIAYPGQELLQQFGGVQDLAAELLKVSLEGGWGSCMCVEGVRNVFVGLVF